MPPKNNKHNNQTEAKPADEMPAVPDEFIAASKEPIVFDNNEHDPHQFKATDITNNVLNYEHDHGDLTPIDEHHDFLGCQFTHYVCAGCHSYAHGEQQLQDHINNGLAADTDPVEAIIKREGICTNDDPSHAHIVDGIDPSDTAALAVAWARLHGQQHDQGVVDSGIVSVGGPTVLPAGAVEPNIVPPPVEEPPIENPQNPSELHWASIQENFRVITRNLFSEKPHTIVECVACADKGLLKRWQGDPMADWRPEMREHYWEKHHRGGLTEANPSPLANIATQNGRPIVPMDVREAWVLDLAMKYVADLEQRNKDLVSYVEQIQNNQ